MIHKPTLREVHSSKNREVQDIKTIQTQIKSSVLMAGVICLLTVNLAMPSVVYAQGAPSIRVSLSSELYRIKHDPKTGTPKMPSNVMATAEVVNWPAGEPLPDKFTWRVKLEWNFKPYPTHHKIGDSTVEMSSPYKIDLSEQVRGGTLRVYAKAMLKGQPVSGVAKAEVRGENPTHTAIFRALPANRFGLIVSKICKQESDLRQFTKSKGSDPGGLPEVSETDDVGIMQLNARPGNIMSEDEIWDWRANLYRGKTMMHEKRHITLLASRSAVDRQRITPIDSSSYQTVACLNTVRWYLGLRCLTCPFGRSTTGLSEAPGSGILPGETDPDHTMISQVERETIRRYNGGREYAYQVVPAMDTLSIALGGWHIDRTRGGVRAKAGDPDYVEHFLKARSGYKIPPPAKPADKKSKGKRHRKRHRRR